LRVLGALHFLQAWKKTEAIIQSKLLPFNFLLFSTVIKMSLLFSIIESGKSNLAASSSTLLKIL
jgi:hypothetical protein